MTLERGTQMMLFSRTKRPEEIWIQVKLETRELVWWHKGGGGGAKSGAKSKADLRLIQEIRSGKNSREFERSYEDVVKHDSGQCLVVIYGNSFKLKSLALAVLTSSTDRDLWIKGLKELVDDAKKASHPVQIDRWLRKEFHSIEKLGKVAFRDFKTWLLVVDVKLSSRRIQDLYKEVRPDMKELSYEEFVKIYHKLMFTSEIFSKYFEKYLDSRKTVSLQSFQKFLAKEQKEQFADDTDAAKALMHGYKLNKKDLQFTSNEFLDYLFSDRNSIWDNQYDQIIQDMNQPLSRYWIASSHNTYLTGDQIKSESSTEAYARVLQRGCRCIELDCWDGPDDYPHIYHGHTLTSRIRFLDALKTIKENAFVTSDYPVILSIENHCSLPQQNAMARGFKDVFGDLLLTSPVSVNEVALPSPNALKRKIIIKHKKLREDGSQQLQNSASFDRGKRTERRESEKEKQTDDGNLDLNASLMTGTLYLEDPFDKKWKPYFFVLTPSTLLYSEETEAAEDDPPILDGSHKMAEEEELNDENRHKSEIWYHGNIKREEAEQILMDSRLGDGAFLIRESATFQNKGECSLSFTHKGSPRNHCRIHCTQDGDRTKYYLTDTLFDSICDLIQHHREFPLKSKGLRQRLKHPVPTKPVRISEPWFRGNLSRAEAEEKLSRISTDGVFLVRQRSSDLHEHELSQYVISFRAERKIKHCLIGQNGRRFVIAEGVFDSLSQLVDYYYKYPLYRKTKLKYPLTETLLKDWGSVYDNQCIADSAIYAAYVNPNSFMPKTKVRALGDYKAQEDDELTFCKDAIITDVVKEDGGWWRGNYGGKERFWFPVNVVEEIDSSMDHKGPEPTGNLLQGSIDMTVRGITISILQKPDCEPMKVFRISIPNAPSREIAVQSEKDLEDWIRALNECISNVSKIAEGRKAAETTMNIAKELSDLIVYCVSSPVDIEKVMASREKTSHADMFSKAETQLLRFFNRERCQGLVTLSSQHIIRVYPKGQRFDSSNYDPMPMWICGCQLVSLNYQTPDLSMQLNEGLFAMNGRCGYVLKPDCLSQAGFNPFYKEQIKGVEPVTISITIIGGRHILKPNRGSSSAIEVVVEVFGCGYEGKNKWKTNVKVDTGLNPVWKEQHMLVEISNPEMALIRFCVQDLDMFGDDNFLGQATYPVKCLKTGFRSIQLKNEHSEPLELASLLVHLSVIEVSKCDLIYTSIQELRFEGNRILEQLENHKNAKNSATIRQLEQRLAKIQTLIFEKMEQRAGNLFD